MLVSHSLADVKSLCDRVILLDKGRVLKDGLPDEVVDYYNALVAQKENAALSIEQRRDKQGWLTTKSGTGEATVRSLRLFDSDTGEELALVRVGQRVKLRLEANVTSDVPSLVLGYMIRDKQGHVIWGTNTWHTTQVQTGLVNGDKAIFELEFTCTLGPGSYSVSPALVSSDTHLDNNFEWIDNLLVFDVMNASLPVFIGSSWLDARFSISREHMADESLG
jgi:lipopolysaccharide transport system ATP-binding protein